jgi:ribosomal protein L7Ae-like RNA K-turn-binding protein
VAAGTDAARKEVRAGRAKLLITASDASPTQIAKVRPAAERRGIAVRVVGTRVRLGEATGGPPSSAVAVTDEGLAEQLLRRIPQPGRMAGESG